MHRHLPWVLWWHSKLSQRHHVFMTHGDQLAFDLWVDLLSAACSASVAPSFLSPDSHELGLVDHWSSYAQLEPVGSTCRIHANGQRWMPGQATALRPVAIGRSTMFIAKTRILKGSWNPWPFRSLNKNWSLQSTRSMTIYTQCNLY